MISELISYSKGFERYLTNDAAKHMRKVEDMSQGDEGRQRQFQKNKEIFNQIKVKWEKNKAEFLSNANPKKAVVVKNSLAYSGGLKIEIATLAHLLKRKYRLCKHMTSRSSSMTETNSSTRCMGNWFDNSRDAVTIREIAGSINEKIYDQDDKLDSVNKKMQDQVKDVKDGNRELHQARIITEKRNKNLMCWTLIAATLAAILGLSIYYLFK